MSHKKPIRVMVADDHPVVRRGIISCLGANKEILVIGEAEDGIEVLDLARKLRPDVILLDLEMPRMTGMAAAEILKTELPSVAVLILTMHRHSEYVMGTLNMGARGYLLKDASPAELIRAIEAVHAGQTYFSPELARVALDGYITGDKSPAKPQLTPREREVLVQIADGLGNKDIAMNLKVGVRTVETHRERIMRKLDIHTIAGLTKYAIRRRLVNLRENWPEPNGLGLAPVHPAGLANPVAPPSSPGRDRESAGA